MADVGYTGLTWVPDQSSAGWRKPSLDLFDRIINISPTDYIFFTHTDNVRTNNVKTQWQLRRLPTRDYASYTQIEGADFVAETNFLNFTEPTRVSNTAHILWIGVSISETSMAEEHYGIANLFNDQINFYSEVWKGAAERAYIRSTESTAASNTTRTMNGLIASITTNATTWGGATTLTETRYIDLLRLVWDNGPKARDVMVNASLQRVIDQFSGNGTRQWFSTEEGITNMVTFYRSTFGIVRNHLSRDLDDTNGTAEIVAIDFKNFHKAWLRRVQMVPLPKTSDGMRGVIVGEMTLKYDDELAAAKGYNLKTTS